MPDLLKATAEALKRMKNLHDPTGKCVCVECFHASALLDKIKRSNVCSCWRCQGFEKDPYDSEDDPHVDTSEYIVGATVRQYHHVDMHDDAIIIAVHPNGALDVEKDGVRYGWSIRCCEVVSA